MLKSCHASINNCKMAIRVLLSVSEKIKCRGYENKFNHPCYQKDFIIFDFQMLIDRMLFTVILRRCVMNVSI